MIRAIRSLLWMIVVVGMSACDPAAWMGRSHGEGRGDDDVCKPITSLPGVDGSSEPDTVPPGCGRPPTSPRSRR